MENSLHKIGTHESKIIQIFQMCKMHANNNLFKPKAREQNRKSGILRTYV